MAESRQNLDDVLGLQGKAGTVTVLRTPASRHPKIQQDLLQQQVLN